MKALFKLASEVAGLVNREKVLLRPFVLDDEDAVELLWKQCGLVRPWNDPRKDIARKLRSSRRLFLVAFVEDRVVGTVMAGSRGAPWVD